MLFRSIYLTNNPKNKEEIKNLKDTIYKISLKIPLPYRGKFQDFIDRLGDKKNPMTFNDMEYFRRMFGEAKTKQVEGFAALSNEQAKELHSAVDALMRNSNKKFDKFISDWKSASEKITGTKGRTASDYIDPFNLQNIMPRSATQFYNQFIKSGTQEAAEEMLRLIGRPNAETMAAIRGGIRNEIENMTADQAKNFINSREGFLRAFDKLSVAGARSLRSDLQRVVQTKYDVEKFAAKEAERIASAGQILKLRQDQISKKIKSSSDLYDKYYVATGNMISAPAEQVSARAKQIVNSLGSDKIISPNEVVRFTRQIDDLSRLKNTEERINKIK
mgnify:CR=1 FL=1